MEQLLEQYEKLRVEMQGILDTVTNTYTPQWVPADFEDLEIDLQDVTNQIIVLFHEMSKQSERH